MRRIAAVVLSSLIAATLVLSVNAGVANAAKNTPCCGSKLSVAKNQGTSSNPAVNKAPGQVNIVTGSVATPQGTVIGTYTSVHTVLSVSPNGTYEILNTTTYKLPKGTIVTSGNEVWTSNVAAQAPTVQVVPISGGTGLYAGVSGTSTNVPAPWPIDVMFTFTNK